MKKFLLKLVLCSIVITSFAAWADPNILVVNGMLNSNPELSPILEIIFYDNTGKACGEGRVEKAPASKDNFYLYQCGEVTHIKITPKSVIDGVWESREQKISYGPAGGVVVLVKSKSMPIFNEDGTINKPGTIESSLTPYRKN